MRAFVLLLTLLVLSGLWSGALTRAEADTGKELLEELKKGLRADDAAARSHAISEVARFIGHLDKRQKKRAAALLYKAYKKETVLDVRLAAVRTFARLEMKAGWVQVINAARRDASDALRALARLEFFAARSDMLPFVRALLEEDEDPTYRAELLLLLRDRRKMDAVPLLIEHLSDKHPRVQSAAAEALEAITATPLGYDPKRWSGWYERWKATQPKTTPEGRKTVAPARRVGKEPEPYTPKSLVPRYYDLPLHAKDIVFLVDISGSVGAQGVTRAKGRLIESVERLGSDVRIGAIFFSDDAKMWEKGQLLRATPENKDKLSYFLRGLAQGRRTDILTPLHAALAMVQRRIDEKVAAKERFAGPVTLVVVSDGQTNKRTVPKHVVTEALERLDPERAVIHSVVLGGEPSALMHALATAGAGRYIVVPSR